MENSSKMSPSPVDGEEVPVSTRKTFGAVFCSGLVAAYGFALLGLFVNAIAFDPNPANPVTEGQIVFAVLMAFVGGLMAHTALKHWRAGRRLVLGADRLQIVEGTGDDAVVKVQFPYWTISKVEFSNFAFGLGLIRIVLSTTQESAIYVPGVNLDAAHKQSGCHFILRGMFVLSRSELVDRINDAINAEAD